MVAIPSKHKSLSLLAVVLLAQLLLLAVQIKRDSHGRLIRVWAITAVSPFERSGAWGFDRVRGVWRHYFALQSTSRENEALRVENDALKLAIAQLQGKAVEADRLAELLNFRNSHKDVPMVGARVIGASAGTASRTVEIDRGERDGIRRDMAVITPDGAVGKVIEVYRDNSQVLLLTDKDGGAGATLIESGIQSPVVGSGESLLSMEFVANDDKVNVGEKVVTSGMDKIFPRYIPVGTVQEIKPGLHFKTILLHPAAKLNHLEDVIVLLSLQPLEIPKDATAPSPEPNSSSAPAANPSAPKSPAPVKP